MSLKDKMHLVPENVKNIASKLDPTNTLIKQNERWLAEQQVEVIRDYCDAVLKTVKVK